MSTKQKLRPDISTIAVSSELRKWYWLKVELATEARRRGIKCSGAKFTILERLCHFYDIGNSQWPGDKRAYVNSNFDWHSSELSTNTIITDNYKNTQNVRRYFKAHVDIGFKFNIDLMDWCKKNTGKTLGDAGRYWQSQKASSTKTIIKSHNQYNQYTRDFMNDNPSLSINAVRKAWALKKALPSESGKHKYERSDLKLLNK